MARQLVECGVSCPLAWVSVHWRFNQGDSQCDEQSLNAVFRIMCSPSMEPHELLDLMDAMGMENFLTGFEAAFDQHPDDAVWTVFAQAVKQRDDQPVWLLQLAAATKSANGLAVCSLQIPACW
jgi:hypothetical protein